MRQKIREAMIEYNLDCLKHPAAKAMFYGAAEQAAAGTPDATQGDVRKIADETLDEIAAAVGRLREVRP